jgi:hypothetical protein
MTHGQRLADTPEQGIRAQAPGMHGQPPGMRGRDHIRAQRRARIALAALLLVLTAAGIRAADPSVSGHGPLHHYGKALGLAVELVLIALLIAVRRRRARSPDAPHVASVLNSMLRTVLGIGLVALPAAALLNSARPIHIHQKKQPAVSAGHPKLPRARKPPPSSAGHLGIEITEWLLLIALLAAIVACVVLIRRWRRAASAAGYDAVPDDDFSAELSRAVESGRLALGKIDDARTAIIACYVAMEESLAEAGAVRAAAETPDELLARAASGGLVRGDAAGRLTALFYEARFSTRPLPQAHRAAAQLALAKLAAELAAGLEAERTARTGAGTGSQGDTPADCGQADS